MSRRIPNLPGYRRSPQVPKPKGGKNLYGNNDPEFGSVGLSHGGSNRLVDTRPRASFEALSATETTKLTFQAYWRETMSSGRQKYRVRKAVISFDLKDGSITVTEKAALNSGMRDGCFLKAARVPKPRDGSFYGIDDLQIGSDVLFYGRRFHISGCDLRTRRWLSDHGVDVPEDETLPADAWEEQNQRPPPTRKAIMQNKRLKKHSEAALGRAAGATEKLGLFLKNDRKVLSFECFWDDRDSLYGDLNRYTLNYFLASSTLEVREHVDPNSGRGTYPMLLRRSRLPKSYESEVCEIEKDASEERFYSERDLKIGETVMVYGKPLVLISCNGSTKRWYLENFPDMTDADFEPIILDEDRPRPPPKRLAPPPMMGGVASFGTEEDSLASCMSLHPKPAKVDNDKLLANAGNNLKFAARFASEKPEDQGRRFVITYYLADDTCSVFEMANKNSGIVPGKFLRRMKVKRGDGSGNIQPEDFGEGRIVRINRFDFVITGMDSYTEEYSVNVNQTLMRMHKLFAPMLHRGGSQGAGAGAAFSLLDADKNNYISIGELREYIKSRLNVQLSAAELRIIMRFFDTNGDGRITKEEFTAWLQTETAEWPDLKAGDTMDKVTSSGEYDASTMATMDQELYLRKIKNALRRFATAFQDKTHHFWNIFIKYDKTKGGVVNKKQFIDALVGSTKFVTNGPARSDILMLADYYYPENVKQLTYAHFIDLLEKQSIPKW